MHFRHSGQSYAYGGERGLLCLSFSSYLKDSGYEGVSVAGHAFWTEVGGSGGGGEGGREALSA